jgi:hypothetical protein
MNSIRNGSEAGNKSGLLTFSRLAVFVLLFIAGACGGHDRLPSSTDQLPGASANSEYLEKMLKFDVRVQDYEISGDKLIVNVNDSWIAAPHGIKERAVGQWFNMFRSSQGNPRGTLQVVVQHQGQEVAKWTPDGGYESKDGQKDSKSSAHSST